MKAKQSSGLNHTTTGRRGSLALHDSLPCAAERAGRQEAARKQPGLREGFDLVLLDSLT